MRAYYTKLATYHPTIHKASITQVQLLYGIVTYADVEVKCQQFYILMKSDKFALGEKEAFSLTLNILVKIQCTYCGGKPEFTYSNSIV